MVYYNKGMNIMLVNAFNITIKYYLVDADDKTHRLGYYQERNMFDTKKQLLESL